MATAASQNFTVILADRNRHIRELLSRELGREGFEVKGCGLGRVAASLAAVRADLLVVDTDLPDLDALSVIQLVRSTRPRLPVAVYAYEEEDAAPCLTEPEVLFVPRGDDPAQLVRAVRSMLFRR